MTETCSLILFLVGYGLLLVGTMAATILATLRVMNRGGKR